MKFVRYLLDQHEKLYAKGTPLEKLYPLHEALDTFLFTPGKVTKRASHVRDALDLKRMMLIVVIALIPCIFMAIYNTGLQTSLAIATGGPMADNWQTSLLQLIGLDPFSSGFFTCIIHGALYYFPILIVTFAAGGLWEVAFAAVRKHEINEGFLVTGMLFPLIVPPSIPLWQVAIGISFGVVVGKEIFGGTGMNFLNPALTARCFLFFAYPQDISGDLVWIAGVDGHSSATMLAVAAEQGVAGLQTSAYSWWDAFLGFIPGSMGETSTLCCLLGAVFLLATKVASWRNMIGVVIGTLAAVLLLNGLAPFVDNPMFDLPVYWHMVLGGWAFGAVFMVTDPVSSAYTDTGRLIYGFSIGVLVVLVRVVNPAFPEGMMLAILLMNAFAPVIDHYVVKKNIKKRMARYAKA